jgi:hypothetical protein
MYCVHIVVIAASTLYCLHLFFPCLPLCPIIFLLTKKLDDAQTHLDPSYACFELVIGLSYMPISSSKHMCITGGPSVCMGSTKMCLGITSHIWGGQKGSQGKINHSILLYYLQ